MDVSQYGEVEPVHGEVPVEHEAAEGMEERNCALTTVLSEHSRGTGPRKTGFDFAACSVEFFHARSPLLILSRTHARHSHIHTHIHTPPSCTAVRSSNRPTVRSSVTTSNLC